MPKKPEKPTVDLPLSTDHFLTNKLRRIMIEQKKDFMSACLEIDVRQFSAKHICKAEAIFDLPLGDIQYRVIFK